MVKDSSGDLQQEDILDVLRRVEWFRRIDAPVPLWSLLVRVGSSVRADAGQQRDEDCFLVVPAAVQARYFLPPVTVIEGGPVPLEISLYSTERLLEDAITGCGIFHWKEARVIANPSSDVLLSSAVEAAGNFSSSRRRRRAWTQYVLFEIRRDHARVCTERDEPAGALLATVAALRCAGGAVLAAHGYWENEKWLVERLSRVAPEVATLLRLYLEVPTSIGDAHLETLGSAVRAQLAVCGFTDSELIAWHDGHPELLEFQMPVLLGRVDII